MNRPSINALMMHYIVDYGYPLEIPVKLWLQSSGAVHPVPFRMTLGAVIRRRPSSRSFFLGVIGVTNKTGAIDTLIDQSQWVNAVENGHQIRHGQRDELGAQQSELNHLEPSGIAQGLQNIIRIPDFFQRHLREFCGRRRGRLQVMNVHGRRHWATFWTLPVFHH